MKQRLGLASTLLGDPATIILDEPANGLDPEGIRWIRDFLRHYADQGRTVLVSSHLLSEMSLMAQDLIVIGKGRLIQQSSVDEFVASNATRLGAGAQPAAAAADARRSTRAGATVKLVGDAAAPDAADVFGPARSKQVGEAAARRRASSSTSCRRRPSRSRTPSCRRPPIQPGVPLGRPVMINTLRAEWIKIRTIVAHWILVDHRRRVPDRRRSRWSRSFGERSTSVPNSTEIAGLIVGLTVVSTMLLGVDVGDQPHVRVQPQHDPTDLRRDAESRCG